LIITTGLEFTRRWKRTRRGGVRFRIETAALSEHAGIVVVCITSIIGQRHSAVAGELLDMTRERDRQLQAFLMELLDDSVSQILAHEDAERFLQWVTHEVIHRGRMEPGLFDSDDEAISLATNFGRGIWNAFPLPGNGFRPQPLATPGRNEACPCGSGRKFKVCCGHGPAPPGLDSGSIWPFLIRTL